MSIATLIPDQTLDSADENEGEWIAVETLAGLIVEKLALGNARIAVKPRVATAATQAAKTIEGRAQPFTPCDWLKRPSLMSRVIVMAAPQMTAAWPSGMISPRDFVEAGTKPFTHRAPAPTAASPAGRDQRECETSTILKNSPAGDALPLGGGAARRGGRNAPPASW